MNVMRWKIRKLGGAIIGLIMLYIFLRSRQYTFTGSTKISNVPPNEVWEYVADFSNMIKLNPLMIDFTILTEKGNYIHWQYSVSYREKLGHWPYLENTNVGHFSVHSNWRQQLYYINSTHTTCFYGVYCLYSDSDFKFYHYNYTDMKPITIGTHYEEVVNYYCPPIFSYFCAKEIKNQRNTIMKNLADQFDK